MNTRLKWKLAQRLEYKWWQHYLRNKDPESYHKWKKEYWQNLLDTILGKEEFPKNKLILDAGCGPAGIFMALQGNDVEALDPLINKYADLAHFIPAKFSWTTFRQMPLESLEEKEKYDIIFCMNAINHVKDVDLCYKNLATALKSGGYLIISTDAHRYRLLEKVFRFIPGDMLHPVQMNIHGYLALLNDVSLNVIKNILFNKGRIFHYYITIAKKPEE